MVIQRSQMLPFKSLTDKHEQRNTSDVSSARPLYQLWSVPLTLNIL